MGRAWSETTCVETRSRESTIYGETRIEAVAQAAQEQGLPDLDHARHFSEMSAAVPVEVITKAVGGRFYYLVRPLL